MDLAHPTLRVWGKGRSGGKWRTVPLSKIAWTELLPFVEGKRPEDRILPWALVTLQLDVRTAARRAGLVASTHDLRRSFGRVAFKDAKVPLTTIQKIYGHASIDTTIRYLGLNLDDMTDGIAAFDRVMAEVA